MRVIREGRAVDHEGRTIDHPPREVTCMSCEAVLEFTRADVFWHPTVLATRVVECPCCGTMLHVHLTPPPARA